MYNCTSFLNYKKTAFQVCTSQNTQKFQTSVRRYLAVCSARLSTEKFTDKNKDVRDDWPISETYLLGCVHGYLVSCEWVKMRVRCFLGQNVEIRSLHRPNQKFLTIARRLPSLPQRKYTCSDQFDNGQVNVFLTQFQRTNRLQFIQSQSLG